jgi:hypothetical protein
MPTFIAITERRSAIFRIPQVLPPMHGASMMDKASALRFRNHILHALEELSSALLVAQKASSEQEFVATRESIGDIVARIDNLLREAIYVDYPDMDDLKDR